MRTNPISSLCVVTLAVFAAGCGADPQTLQSLKDAVNTVSTESALVQHDAAEQTSLDAPFEPAYPNRVDPFSFPSSGPVSNQEGTTIATVAQVEVLGFAEIDEPRVFLRTKETTKSLRVGDSTDGVRVIAINAPKVELQMGSLVWTASMFDHSNVGRD